MRVGISEDSSLRSLTIAGARLPGLPLGERPEQMSCGDRKDLCPSSRPARRAWERELDSCTPPSGAWQDCIQKWAVTHTCNAMPATSRTRRRQAARATAQAPILSPPSFFKKNKNIKSANDSTPEKRFSVSAATSPQQQSNSRLQFGASMDHGHKARELLSLSA